MKLILHGGALYKKQSKIFTGTGETVRVKIKKSKVRTAAKTGDRSSVLIQYVDRGNVMRPTERTAPRLREGIYEVLSDWSGPYFERQEVNTDALLRFEDPIHTEILGDMDKFWKQKDKFKKKGFLHNRAVLMFGPPGSGKSCIVKLAIEDLINKGDVVFSASNIGNLVEGLKLFREVEPDRRCLAILEDVDELGEHTLLQLLDGTNTADNIMYLATTNYVNRLSQRILRPGRFDRKIEVPYPPAPGRKAYLESKLGDENLTQEQMNYLIKKTEGFSFGHLRELVTAVYCMDQPLKVVLRRLRGNGLELAPIEAGPKLLEKSMAVESAPVPMPVYDADVKSNS